jgi:hypothetical protein
MLCPVPDIHPQHAHGSPGGVRNEVPSSSAMFRLLATSSLDKLPVGRESWMSSPLQHPWQGNQA